MRWCFVSPGYRSTQVLAGDTSSSGGAEAQIAHLASGSCGSWARGRPHIWRRADVVSQTRFRVSPASQLRRPGGFLQVSQPSGVPWTCCARMFSMRAFRPISFGSWAFLPDAAGLRASYTPWRHDLHCTPWTAYDHKKWLARSAIQPWFAKHRHDCGSASPASRLSSIRV